MRNVFRRKVGFDVYTSQTSTIRKEQILNLCHENKNIFEQYLDFDKLIKLVELITKERHMFRIEVLLVWMQGLHAKQE